jgi:hyperosmotically inducible protein
MKAIVKTSQAILLTALLSAAFAGCDRKAPDQTTGAAGTSGNSAGTPTTTAGTSGGTASTTPGNTAATTGSSTDTSTVGAASTASTTGTVASNDSSSGASGTTGTSAGTVIDDSVITTKVKTALLADSDVKGTDISVETKKGEVLLSGFVGNQSQVDKALKVANSVDGVKSVNNKMTVKQ